MKPSTATPHVIIMLGIPGAGKTTFAEQFAKTFHAPLISHQALKQAGDIDDKQTLAIAATLLHELFKTKRTIVYDGQTDTKAMRQALVKKIISAGYTPLLVWIQTESVEAKRRATRRGGNHTAEEFDQAVLRFQTPIEKEAAVVISGKHTYATQLKVILKHLAGGRPSDSPPDSEQPRPRSTRNIILR